MKFDILFVARNRLAFTMAAGSALLQNTNWNLVRHIWVIDDGSTDGTRDYLANLAYPVGAKFIFPDARYGGPADITKEFIAMSDAEIFAKIDNDVIVPPGWADAGLSVMVTHPELDLLGIEQPYSRTPHVAGGPQSPWNEYTDTVTKTNLNQYGYVKVASIGGIGFMRRTAFIRYPDLTSYATYGGFTDWQLRHHDICKGWIAPPLDVLLLDRLPIDPWKSLSQTYIQKNWQRAWSSYPMSNPFWEWWMK